TLSRILGIVRDIVTARASGASLVMDPIIVAFRIRNFLRRLFAEGGLSQACVPVLAEYRQTRSHEEVRALVDRTATTLTATLLLVSAAGVVLAPLFILVFAPGFLGELEKRELATAMLRITFPYLLFISLTALAGGVLNTYRCF